MQSLLPNWPIRSAAFIEDPFQFYQRRREHSPIGKTASGPWCLTGYDMIEEALRHPDISALPNRAGTDNTPKSLQELGSRWVVFCDPPVHTRIRHLVGHSFHRLVKEDGKKIINEVLEKLIADISAKNEIEFIEDFAFPMPLYVILKLIGVPESDWPQVSHWVKRLSILIDPYSGITYPPADIEAAASSLMDYLVNLVEQRRKQPCHDLISGLVEGDANGDALSTMDLISNVSFLLFAGHETTVNLMGNGLLAVLQERRHWQDLCANKKLIPSALEEFLRYDSPVQLTVRQTSKDVIIGDCHIPAGEELRLFLGAANRDPSRFEQPDQLILNRSPNPHLAFGKGDHSCMGALLARLEGKMAFKTLCENFPNMALATTPAQRKIGLNLRGLLKLPVKLRA